MCKTPKSNYMVTRENPRLKDEFEHKIKSTSPMYIIFCFILLII